MDPRTIITGRIDVQLRRHLGHGVDTHRALHDERYARDLLLVCDAMEDTELPMLAAEFRNLERHMIAARRALAPRDNQRIAAPYVRQEPASLAQRLMSFGRAR